MILEETLSSVRKCRELMNEGKVEEINRRITDDFIAVFSSTEPQGFNTFNAEQYREGNIQALQSYEGKKPHWKFEDLEAKVRSDHEIVVSSKVTFSLNEQPYMHALCMEIYRYENNEWKLARQYMEKYKQDSDFPFQSIHNEYWLEWDRAMTNGDTTELENRMADEYYVTFFMTDKKNPVFFDRTDAIEGMRQSILDSDHAKKRMQNRVIRMKDDENAVVFYEQILEKNGENLSRMYTVENWKRLDGKWKIIREVQEHVG